MTHVWLFFLNDTATTEIYTLSLHDALPISVLLGQLEQQLGQLGGDVAEHQGLELVLEIQAALGQEPGRSEEHTSELQSRQYLVCRLLLEKKKTIIVTRLVRQSLAKCVRSSS